MVTMPMDTGFSIKAVTEAPSAAFITTDFSLNEPREANGCAHYRCLLPSRELVKLGWDVGFGAPISHPDHGIGLAVNGGGYFGFQVAIFKLLMQAETTDLMKVMQRNETRVIVDIDDFHFGIQSDNIASQITDPSRNVENNRMFYEMSIRQADKIITSTAFLADFYSRRCRDVRIVRNALDTERYTPVEQPEKPVFGWVGSIPWRGRDVTLLSRWLPQFQKQYAVGVHHSGHVPFDPRHFGVRVGLRRVSTAMMTPMSRYPSLLTQFHVGLVPLVRNDFNEAKSYLKGLEYAASGIPFIATPTEEYRLLHEAGVGRLALTPAEWWDHAVELLDVDVRRAEAERQLAVVREQFDIGTKGEEWASTILG